MQQMANAERRAFAIYLRTGRRIHFKVPTGIELKFNPYHDPRNGQFTFAPGGVGFVGRSSMPRRDAASSAGEKPSRAINRSSDRELLLDANPAVASTSQPKPIPLRPSDDVATLQMAAYRPEFREPRGSNSRAFLDPMTLEQVFPGLRSAAPGITLALADNFFDFTGPSRDITTGLAEDMSKLIIRQIKAIDPSYKFESLGAPQTFDGQMNELNALRFQRAAAFLRKKQELRPMQVETLRFMQKTADIAYAQGLTMLRAGRLKVVLSEQEALGNFVDREVRIALRESFKDMA